MKPSYGHLRFISRCFGKKHNKWYAALEQSGISASNFFISIMVLQYSGLATLGEYGFWFALCEFATLLLSGYAINNMVLYAGNTSVPRQRKIFLITLSIVVVLVFVPCVILWLSISLRNPSSPTGLLAIPIVLYVAFYNIAELIRQFLYMRGRQRYSLLYSACSVIISVLIFCFLLFVFHPHYVLELVFFCLALIQLLYVFFALLSSRAWRFIPRPERADVLECAAFYWNHGRMASAGMLVAWAQNKSINPVLVLTLGTVAAGYYQVAKMIFMPITMITVGFARSAMKPVRNAWGDGDEKQLLKAIMRQLRTSLLVVVSYLAVAALGIFALSVSGLKEIPHELMLIFGVTAIVVFLSNFRYWLSLHYAVQLQFTYLFNTGCVAAILSLGWMFSMGYLTKLSFLVAVGPGVGECLLLFLLHQRMKRDMASVTS